MKRFLLPALLGTLFMTASCMEEYVPETSPQASINAFQLGYFKVRFHDMNYKGRDTIVYNRESGVMYPMTIDQLGNRIYNIDSLAYGSQLSAVNTYVSATGTVLYRYKDETVYNVWSSSDSIDFTRPLVFTAVSSDGSYEREYSVELNVRTVFPDSLIWTQSESKGFPEMAMRGSAIKSDTLFAFGLDSSGRCVVSYRNILSSSWSIPAELTGITPAWYSVVVTRGNRLYTVCDSNLFSSADGIAWTQCASGFKTLFAQIGETGQVWAISTDGNLISSNDMVNWKTVQALPAGFPDKSCVTSSLPLATNQNIIRTVAVGNGNDGIHSSVWSMISTDSVWTRIEAATYVDYRLPALDRLSLIRYDGSLFAFGSGFEGFWQSRDHGVTWHKCDKFAQDYSSWNQYMQLPEDLAGYWGDFSCVTDRLGSIWIMTSDGHVWRGAINRLNKR